MFHVPQGITGILSDIVKYICDVPQGITGILLIIIRYRCHVLHAMEYCQS